MIIISHRGYWKVHEEKNTLIAFERSFSHGFGTETDIRDYNSKLVISHDIPHSKSILLEEFFEMYIKYKYFLPLALNIKSNGLQYELGKLLLEFDIYNYFVFDMAVPDALVYAKNNFIVYTRHSDFETVPSFYNLAHGVWLDEFNGHWLTDEVIEDHLDQHKSLCIVSPDLHMRDNHKEWLQYKNLESRIGKDKLMICTDFPENAQFFFND